MANEAFRKVGNRLVYDGTEYCSGCGEMLVMAPSQITDPILNKAALPYIQGDCPVCDDWGDGVQLLVQR